VFEEGEEKKKKKKKVKKVKKKKKKKRVCGFDHQRRRGWERKRSETA
jgi:hypothetical protein